jgi:hypothetical protein
MEYSPKLHKTLTPLRRWPSEELRALAEGVEAILEERTREESAPVPVADGWEVVEERRVGGVTMRLEHVRCGKEACHCATDRGHGPYWYAYTRQDGRLTSTYLGKTLDETALGRLTRVTGRGERTR